MDQNEYLWIYGLAEALVVTAVLAAFMGFKWWRLHREKRERRAASARIHGLFEKEIARADSETGTRSEWRECRIASLRALSRPFARDRIGEEAAWSEALDHLDRCFGALARTAANPIAAPGRPVAETSESRPYEPPQAFDDEGLASPGIESDVEALLEQYQLGRATFASNQANGGDLRQKYRDLLQVNQGLRARIDTLGPSEETDTLREELDGFLRSNLAFMRAALTAERNFNLLEQQFDDFEERIHGLQMTINTYRKSVHKLLSERDLLNEEKQQSMIQLDLKDKLIARLNRNYETLRREYAKIYGGTG